MSGSNSTDASLDNHAVLSDHDNETSLEPGVCANHAVLSDHDNETPLEPGVCASAGEKRGPSEPPALEPGKTKKRRADLFHSHIDLVTLPGSAQKYNRFDGGTDYHSKKGYKAAVWKGVLKASEVFVTTFIRQDRKFTISRKMLVQAIKTAIPPELRPKDRMMFKSFNPFFKGNSFNLFNLFNYFYLSALRLYARRKRKCGKDVL